MLNDRLTAYSQSHHLVNKEQIDFQNNSRTADHILTLKVLVNKYGTDKKGKKLYACFVDFKKGRNYMPVSLILKREEIICLFR